MFEDIKPHIIELRTRLMYTVLGILIGCAVCFNFWESILHIMTAPLKAVLKDGSSIVFTEVGEVFFSAIKISLFTGFLVSLPATLYQIWLFISPALYAHEKKFVIPFVLSATIMFLVGDLFAYYIILPYGLQYLIGFGDQLFTALPSLSAYVEFFAKIMLGFGIAFELPIITFFLAVIGVVDDKILKDFFKYAVVVIFVLSALLTPPDIFTQVLMSVPLILLYAISIFIASLVVKKDKNNVE